MKEHSLVAGGRKWFGTDLVELQKEPLDAVTALVADYAPCIVGGCEVTVDGGDTMSVTAGVAVMRDANGKPRLVRVPASTPAHVDYHARWLTLVETPTARPYDDGTAREVSREYVAQWSATQQKSSDIQFIAPVFGNVPVAPRLAVKTGAAGVGPEVHFTGGIAGHTLDVYVRANYLTRMVHARGVLNVMAAQSITTVYNRSFDTTVLPADWQPQTDFYFSYHRRVHSVSPEQGLELSLPIAGRYRPGLSGGTGFCASPTKPEDPNITSYVAYFNVSWPMA